MKRFITLFAIVATCCAVAAPANLSAKEPKGNSKSSEANIEDGYWYKRLNELKKAKIAKDLKLVDFEYLGKITSEKQKEKVIKQCLNNKATMMYAPNSRYFRYDVTTVKNLKANKPEFYEYLKEHITQNTDRIKLNDAEIVKLKWEYKGEKFESYAVVTNTTRKYERGGSIPTLDYMIYDNILMPLRTDACVLIREENGGKTSSLPFFSLS